jgi:hypothetical protein
MYLEKLKTIQKEKENDKKEEQRDCGFLQTFE